MVGARILLLVSMVELEVGYNNKFQLLNTKYTLSFYTNFRTRLRYATLLWICSIEIDSIIQRAKDGRNIKKLKRLKNWK